MHQKCSVPFPNNKVHLVDSLSQERQANPNVVYSTWWLLMRILGQVEFIDIIWGNVRCELIVLIRRNLRKSRRCHIDLIPKTWEHTVYPKKYAHGFCFALLCCGYTLTDFPISIRLTSLALWQSNDCPSASKVTLMNMDEYFMWIHYERLHNHNKAKHNKNVCIFLGIYCILLTETS